MPFVLLVVAVAAIAFFVFVPRLNELFLLSVRDGEVLLVRGRIPIRVQQDIADVIRRAQTPRGSIRAVRSHQASRLVVRGMDEGTAQRLRNVFGIHPVQRLRAAPLPVNGRNVGQILGFAWLAWLFVGRR
ncbi:MAG: DUF3634 family protein [Myxococcota bacterium]